MASKKPASKRKYGPKASEKVEQAMREMKRGTLRSGSGHKVKSREQAIAIGLSQARRAGGKVPPAPGHAKRKASAQEHLFTYRNKHGSWSDVWATDADDAQRKIRKRGDAGGFFTINRVTNVPPRGGSSGSTRHAAMSLDARVRAHLSKMAPGREIDAAGMARALGGADPLGVAYALERAEEAGDAVSSDGRWYGPRPPRTHRAKMLSSTPVVKVERVTLPSGESAAIHIHAGKGGYGGVLVLPSGDELPMSLGVPAPQNAAEALRGAKRFLGQVYGKTN